MNNRLFIWATGLIVIVLLGCRAERYAIVDVSTKKLDGTLVPLFVVDCHTGQVIGDGLTPVQGYIIGRKRGAPRPTLSVLAFDEGNCYTPTWSGVITISKWVKDKKLLTLPENSNSVIIYVKPPRNPCP